jgi:undecaprenyl-diphosphatase
MRGAHGGLRRRAHEEEDHLSSVVSKADQSSDRHSYAAELASLRADLRAQAVARWPRWLTPSLAVGCALGALALLFMSLAAHTESTFSYDVGVTRAVQHLAGTPLEPVINLAGDLQGPVLSLIGMAVIYGALLVLRLFVEFICLAICGIGADVTHVVMNALVARPRPHGRHVEQTLGTLGQSSYPSGHTAHTLALYGFVFYLLWLAARARPAWRPWLVVGQVICGYFILGVGLSRVLKGLHWPSDVLAGYLLAAIFLALGTWLYHRMAARWPGDRRGADGVLAAGRSVS